MGVIVALYRLRTEYIFVMSMLRLVRSESVMASGPQAERFYDLTLEDRTNMRIGRA